MFRANLLSCRPRFISPRLSADLLRFRRTAANQRCTACPAKCWRRTIFVPNERRLLVDRRRKTEWTGVGAHGAKFRISPAPAVGPDQWKLVVHAPSRHFVALVPQTVWRRDFSVFPSPYATVKYLCRKVFANFPIARATSQQRRIVVKCQYVNNILYRYVCNRL